jgi:hypothetical protein
MMDSSIGFIVGIVVAAAAIISGIAGLVIAKKNERKSKWPVWVIVFGIVALISAAVNYGLFS